MARIPLAESPYIPRNIPQNNIYYAGAPGRAVQEVGESVASIGLNALERQTVARDLTAVTDATVEFEKQNLEKMTKFQQENSAEPVGKGAQYDDQLRSDLDEVSQTMPSLRARTMFQRQAGQIRSNTVSNMARWEKLQELDNFKTNSDKTSDNFNTIAYRSANFGALPKLLAQVDEAKLADESFAGPAEAEKQRLSRRRSVTANTFLGAIDRDVNTAESMLNSKKYDSDLGAEGIVQVKALIQQKQRQNQEIGRKIDGLMEKDPYAYMQAVGDTQGFEPLKLGTEGTTDSFQQRQRYRDRAKVQYGIDLPVLTPNEAKSITKILESTNDNDATIFIESLSRSITSEQFIPMSKQLFKENPAIGVAMSIADEDPTTTRNIIRGNALIKKDAVLLPANNSLESSIYTKIGNAITDPSLRASTFQAVRANYAAQSQASGYASKDIVDEALVTKATQDVIGPTIRTGKNSANTLSFRGEFGKTKQIKFLDQDNFDDMLDNLTDEDISKVQGTPLTALNGDPISAKLIQKRGEFQAIGDGQYIININGEYIPAKNGQPMIFDFKKIQARQNSKPKSRFFGLISDQGADQTEFGMEPTK